MQFKTLSTLALVSGTIAQSMNLTALLSSVPELSNLSSYVTMFPDLVSQLSNAFNVTILAPSNDAFSHLISSTNTSPLSGGNDTIHHLLMYHVLQGTYPSVELHHEVPVFIPTMLTNASVTNITGGQRVGTVSMDDTLYFLSGLMKNATVTRADLPFTGGIVHVIDSVLTLPTNISTTAVTSNLTSFAGALRKADLVHRLDTSQNVMVFAPDNAAFQSIASAITDLSTEQLAEILRYHMINGTVAYSSDLENDQTLTTASGEKLTIRLEDDEIFVNSAKVVIPNVLVANGVVHVIDNVLNPNNIATPNPTATTQSPAFTGATSATDVPFTSGVESLTATGTGAATTSKGVAMPMRTHGIGAVAVVGGVALLNNLIF